MESKAQKKTKKKINYVSRHCPGDSLENPATQAVFV